MKFHLSICCLIIGTYLASFGMGLVDETLNDMKVEKKRLVRNIVMKKEVSVIKESKNPCKERIFFDLYTKRNPMQPQKIRLNCGSAMNVRESNFDCTKPTVFVTHGWLNSGKSNSCTIIRDAYLKHTDTNVIVVDWSKLSHQLYSIAVKNTEIVGKKIAETINYLQSQANLDVGRTTLIGHSLGAHVMGVAGYNTKSVVKIVFGLDPAGVLFEGVPESKRIGTKSAEYVQVIHTNGGAMGFLGPLGHSDFYVNGGKYQVGCSKAGCSHMRAPEYFAESIDPCRKFWASKCADFSCVENRRCTPTSDVMGGIAPQAQGIYYVETNSASPYARG